MYVKRLKQANQGRQPNLAHSALDARYLYGRKPRAVRELFLRPATSFPRRPHVFAKALDISIHGADRLAG